MEAFFFYEVNRLQITLRGSNKTIQSITILQPLSEGFNVFHSAMLRSEFEWTWRNTHSAIDYGIWPNLFEDKEVCF